MSYDESIEYDEVVFPYLVIDFLSLFYRKEVQQDKVLFVEEVWNNFNIVFWREKKILGYRSKDELLKEYYDLDSVRIMECSRDRIFKWVKFNNTLMISSRIEIRNKFSQWALESYNSKYILHNFDSIINKRG